MVGYNAGPSALASWVESSSTQNCQPGGAAGQAESGSHPGGGAHPPAWSIHVGRS